MRREADTIALWRPSPAYTAAGYLVAAASVNGSGYNFVNANPGSALTYANAPRIVRGPQPGTFSRHFNGLTASSRPEHRMTTAAGLTDAITLFNSGSELSIQIWLRLDGVQTLAIPFSFCGPTFNTYELVFGVYIDGQTVAVEWSTDETEPGQIFTTDLTDDIPLNTWTLVTVNVTRASGDWTVEAFLDDAQGSNGPETAAASSTADATYVMGLGWEPRNGNARTFWGSIACVRISNAVRTPLQMAADHALGGDLPIEVGTTFERWDLRATEPAIVDHGPYEMHLQPRGTGAIVLTEDDALAIGRRSLAIVAGGANTTVSGVRSPYLYDELQAALQAGSHTIEAWCTTPTTWPAQAVIFSMDGSLWEGGTIEAEGYNIQGALLLLGPTSGNDGAVQAFTENGAGGTNDTPTSTALLAAAQRIGTHHFAIVTDGSHGCTFYTDATQLGSASVSGVAPTGGANTIPYLGCFQPSGSAVTVGMGIQEVRISSAALTQPDVEASYLDDFEGGMAPTVTVVAPSFGGVMVANALAEIEVTDDTELATVEIPGVYEGGVIQPGWESSSSVTPLEDGRGGLGFALIPDDGWPYGIRTLTVVATDTDGNESTTELAWDYPDDPPVVVDVTPVIATELANDGTVTFTVEGAESLEIPGVYEEGDFLTGWSGTVTPDGADLDVEVAPDGEWPAGIRLLTVIATGPGGTESTTLLAWDHPGEAVDAVEPRIVDVSPPVGTPISSDQAINFTVVDATLRAVVIEDRNYNTVYNSRTFRAPFALSEMVETTYEGEYAQTFTVRRQGGWSGTRVLRVSVTDAAGNHEVLVG